MTYSKQLNQAYEVLKKTNLDTPENRTELASKTHPLQTAFAFKILQEEDLLMHRAAILSHPQPHLLANGLKKLKYAHLDCLFIHLDGLYPDSLATILISLDKTKLVKPEIITRLHAHSNLQNLAFAIPHLHQFSILNAITLDLILKHPFPYRVAQALSYLARVDLLNSKNQRLVIQYLYPEILHVLHNTELLNQENLNLVFSPSHAFLFSPAAIEILWQQWPSELIRTHWPRILATVQAPIPQIALQALTDAVLTPLETAVILNSSQSTHTASIHQSTTQAIVELNRIYGNDLKTLDNVQINLHGLADHPKNKAAQRCLERLSALAKPELTNLVCLAFTALHDESRRQGSLKDGLQCFVDGLYEIQRGYNLDEHGKDLGGPDKPICIAGSMNKIIEKLVGYHPAVELKFITHELANLKFPIMVNEEICHYLKSLASPNNLQELGLWRDCVEQLTCDGIDSIWPKIKDALIPRFLEEFGSLYQDRDFAKFQDLIANLAYLKIPDLSQFQAQLSESQGYRDYLKGLAFRNHSLWYTKNETLSPSFSSTLSSN